ncbi:MAG: hypothetical protein U0V70_19395 [Terriglobia bacterium]
MTSFPQEIMEATRQKLELVQEGLSILRRKSLALEQNHLQTIEEILDEEAQWMMKINKFSRALTQDREGQVHDEVMAFREPAQFATGNRLSEEEFSQWSSLREMVKAAADEFKLEEKKHKTLIENGLQFTGSLLNAISPEPAYDPKSARDIVNHRQSQGPSLLSVQY